MTAASSFDDAQPALAADGPDAERLGNAVAIDETANGVPDEERYRLVSIESVRAPEGCAGKDWFVYRIAQGDNGITGYRRGDRDRVSTEVHAIVDGLNGRRRWTKPKTDAKAERRAAAARRKSSE